jgi:serine/threonine-protein kinase HipA
MRAGRVFCNGIFAGVITEENRKSYIFRYDDAYFINRDMPDISLTLPKTQQEYRSEYLFPFFFNMLTEGHNRKMQSYLLKIDEQDHFGIMLATARCDTVGAVTIKPFAP